MKGGEVTPPPPVVPKAIRNLGRVRPQKSDDQKKTPGKKAKGQKKEKQSDEQNDTEQTKEEKDLTGRGKVVDVVA